MKRKRFIESAVTFCQKYDFDGIDLVWMYPGVGWRGGVPEDKQNFVKLIKELKEAFRLVIIGMNMVRKPDSIICNVLNIQKRKHLLKGIQNKNNIA